MKEQLLDAWRISNSMNLLVIDNLDEAALVSGLSAKGRNVYQQLVHMHNVRLTWLEIIAKDIWKTCKSLDSKDEKADRKKLRAAFDESGKAIAEFINMSWDSGGKVKSFKTGLIPFISYLMAHEAHHRGNMLLTIKQNGFKIPDALKWGLWEWGK